MKKNYFTILVALIFFSVQIAYSQKTEVINGLTGDVLKLAVNGNDLYIGDYDNEEISKIDLAAATPEAQIIRSNFAAGGMLVEGNDLYSSRFNIAPGGMIEKLDLSLTTSPSVIIFGLEAPTGIALRGDILYYSLYDGKIAKLDISEASPNSIDVFNDSPGIWSIALAGDYLYASEDVAGNIFKIDITSATPTRIDLLTGLDAPDDLVVIGNDLYFTELGAGTLSKVDLTTKTKTVLLTGLNEPSGLAYNGKDLYISEIGNGTISKIAVTNPLSLENDYSVDSGISVYPNPSNGVIQLTGLKEKVNYKIYDALGAEVARGIVLEKDYINIESLKTGLYFLKLEKGNTVKFTKN